MQWMHLQPGMLDLLPSTWAGTLSVPLEQSEVSSLRCYWMFQAGSQGQEEQIVLTCSEVSRELHLITRVLCWAC